MNNDASSNWHAFDGQRPVSLSLLEWQWLSYPGSLTEKFHQSPSQRAEFCLLREGWDTIRISEARLLGLADDSLSHWVRYSEWRCLDAVWMAARTVIPRTCTRSDLFLLASRPIGKVLFSSPNCRRCLLHYAHLLPTDPDYLAISSHRSLPQTTQVARRSAFTWGEDSVLVSEVFFPDFFEWARTCPL